MTRPGVHQRVVLELAAGERIGARVEDVGSGAVTVALLEGGSRVGVPGARLTLEFTDDRGLERVRAAARPGDRPGTLALELDGEVERSQRRDFARVAAVLPVLLVRDSDEPIGTFAVNVSGGGALIAGPHDLEPGDVVWFRLRLPGAPVEVAGTVVRESEGGHKGVEFGTIAERDRDAIVRFVFERQRLARRAERDD